MQNNCTNSKIELSELLKRIRKSICGISQTIDYMNARPQKAGVHEQFMLEHVYELLASLHSMLEYSYSHAKNEDEIRDVKELRDLIKTIVNRIRINDPKEKYILNYN